MFELNTCCSALTEIDGRRPPLLRMCLPLITVGALIIPYTDPSFTVTCQVSFTPAAQDTNPQTIFSQLSIISLLIQDQLFLSFQSYSPRYKGQKLLLHQPAVCEKTHTAYSTHDMKKRGNSYFWSGLFLQLYLQNS